NGATGATGPTGPQGTTGATGATGASPWSLNGADTYYTAGKVGIGTTVPGAVLNILGTGTNAYQGIKVQNTFADATAKGSLAIVGARYTNANAPFSALGTWD